MSLSLPGLLALLPGPSSSFILSSGGKKRKGGGGFRGDLDYQDHFVSFMLMTDNANCLGSWEKAIIHQTTSKK